MSKRHIWRGRDLSFGAIGVGLGAIAARLAVYFSMRSDVDAIQRDISRGRAGAAAIKNHTVRPVASPQRSDISRSHHS
jgi:hypothetical protein